VLCCYCCYYLWLLLLLLLLLAVRVAAITVTLCDQRDVHRDVLLVLGHIIDVELLGAFRVQRELRVQRLVGGFHLRQKCL
jgi:hypothetical protein